MTSWSDYAARLVEARSGTRAWKAVFSGLHRDAAEALRETYGADPQVRTAFSGSLHPPSSSGAKFEREPLLVEVFLTDHEIVTVGGSNASLLLERIPLEQVSDVRGALAKGALFKKFYALWVQVSEPEDQPRWHVVTPDSKDNGPRLLQQIVDAGKASRHA